MKLVRQLKDKWADLKRSWRFRGGIEAYIRRSEAKTRKCADIQAAEAVGISRWQLWWMQRRDLPATQPDRWETQGQPLCPRCGSPRQLYRPPTGDQPEAHFGFCGHSW